MSSAIGHDAFLCAIEHDAFLCAIGHDAFLCAIGMMLSYVLLA